MGLISGIGDIIPLVISFYIVWIAARLNMPDQKVAKMIQNIFTDFIIGVIPVIGDIGDFFYKANSKNMKLISEFRSQAIADAELVV